MCKAGLERVTSKRCQVFSLKNSLFEEMPTITYRFSEITSKDPSRVKFDHGVHFFLVHCFSLHKCGPWLQRCGVTSHRQGWCTLCLCCHFATSCITLAGWEETLAHHDEPCLQLVALVFLLFSVSVPQFTAALHLNFFSKGAETHSNASGNWSCADVYSAARTNSSVTWPCKHSHSNCIQLEYENFKSLRSAPFG